MKLFNLVSSNCERSLVPNFSYKKFHPNQALGKIFEASHNVKACPLRRRDMCITHHTP